MFNDVTFDLQSFANPTTGLSSAQFISVQKLHLAEMTSDTSSTTTDSTPVDFGKVLRNVKVTPSNNTAEAYADGQVIDTVADVAKFDLEIETAALPLEYIAWLLGHGYSAGTMTTSKDDVAPHFAMMFQADKRNGKARFMKFYKVSFQEPDTENKTKEENIEFQYPTLKATAIYRISDGKAYAYGDEEDSAFTAKSTWYTTV